MARPISAILILLSALTLAGGTCAWFHRTWGAGPVGFETHLVLGALTSLITTVLFAISVLMHQTDDTGTGLVAAHLALGFALPLGAVLSLDDEVGAGVHNTLLVLVGQWTLVGSAALAAAVIVRRAAVGARPTETTPG